MVESGREFYKLSGSGNDFVFFDTRAVPAGALERPDTIRGLCARTSGVGADGVVFLEGSASADVRMRYFNSDGSRASLCGNASLCATRLAVELGAVDPSGFLLETDAGILRARMSEGSPEIDFAPVTDVNAAAPIAAGADEERIGFALAGVPHLVVRVRDVEAVRVDGRGGELRRHASLLEGANVNFVSPASPGSWFMRTYERGVEGETLACGTGAVASAAVLTAWGETSGPTTMVTRSGRSLVVRPPSALGGGPSLMGEGRLVFRGTLEELL